MRFQVDASLNYRPLAIALVSTLIDQIETADRNFRNDMITAFGEAFNNIVIHGYRDRSDGSVQVEAELRRDEMTLRLMDDGLTIDFSTTSSPDLDDLPERGMGIFMIHALVDHVAYSGDGPLNVMTLVKSTGCQDSAPSQLSNRTELR